MSLLNDILRTIGASSANSVGLDHLSEVRVTSRGASDGQLAYFFEFRVDQDSDRRRASTLMVPLSQKIRDELIARHDETYPFVRILNLDEWRQV